MIIKLLVAPIILLVASMAYAKEVVFYKFYEGDDRYSFIVADRDTRHQDPSVDFFISSHIIARSFNVDSIPKTFYNIRIDDNILFFGNYITQYEMMPIEKDRSKVVLWVDKDSNVLKVEAYDIDNRLQIAFANFNTDSRHKRGMFHKRGGKHAMNTPFYKGFIHVRTNIMPFNVKHLLFTDKVNRFSLFIDSQPRGFTKSEQVVHGNNLLSKVVNGIEYAVIGTVTYEFMDKFIDAVAEHKTSIDNELEKMRLLTADIFSK